MQELIKLYSIETIEEMKDYILYQGITEERVSEMSNIEIEKCFKALRFMSNWN